MNRRYFGVAMALVSCGLPLYGCQSLNHGSRGKDRDPDVAPASAETKSIESGGDKVLDVQSDGKEAKPFFRSSRLSSGLSPEAREVENSLGIH